jgi:Mrp family chromosome partitioning ATPase
MDRLERALQKAREQRESVVVKEAAEAEARANVPPAAPAAPSLPAFKSKKIVVPEKALERHRIVARMARSPNADIFRILRTKVLRHLNDAKLTTVAITSPNYGDGKTTIAVNLALSLALDVKQTVLLVDLDLRDPTIHTCLGIEPDVGLSDYFVDDVPVAQCLVNPGIERLVVLPVRNRLEQSSEALGTPKMAKLAHELKTRYPDRIVIYDMPPLLAQDDVIAFLPLVDAVLLVVRDGVTPAEDIRQCMHALEGTNLIGTVLNNSVERGYARD